jgi:hypothetical protein
MKRHARWIILAFAAACFALNSQARTMGKQTAVIEFFDRTDVAKVVLDKGKYLFEHDDERMARGEACMNVYSYVNGKADRLVVSFHCQMVERKLAATTITNEEMTREPGVFRLKEIQFAGTTKGHLVPVLP